MSRTGGYLLLSFMLILTILYCCFIYLGMGLYVNLLESHGMNVFSNFTTVTSTSPFIWQILAVASFMLNPLFAILSSKKRVEPSPFATAAALHISWLSICSLLHGIGCLLPLVTWMPVLE